MQVTLEVTGKDLVLLYLATGNEDAGRIVLAAARAYAKDHPRETKRGRPVGSAKKLKADD